MYVFFFGVVKVASVQWCSCAMNEGVVGREEERCRLVRLLSLVMVVSVCRASSLMSVMRRQLASTLKQVNSPRCR